MKLYILIFTFFFLVSIDLMGITSHDYSYENNLSKDSVSLLKNSTSPNKKRIQFMNYTCIGLYSASMTWLYSQWYNDYKQTHFHFFNDDSEWEQMDKFAHGWAAYNIAKPVTKCYRWAGVDKKKSVLYGAGIALLFQTSVEIFDGFSSEWGFSGGDMLANSLGIGLYTFQELKWNEQRINLKVSFSQSQYSKYRPDILGKNLQENILKDYNGLTFWLTVSPRSFFKKTKIPGWLNLAVGFGADGMTGGKDNPTTIDGKEIPSFNRYKQIYLSFDIELAKIRVKSQFLSSLFKLVNIIHLPLPAIELSNKNKPVYHAIYF